MGKLAAVGHSMGALTAIEMWYKYKDDFKICATMDAYFRPKLREITEKSTYVIDQPIFLSSSDYFLESPFMSDYDNKATNDKFFQDTWKHNGKKNYNVDLKDAGHLSALDAALQVPSVLSLTKMVGQANKVAERQHENHMR